MDGLFDYLVVAGLAGIIFGQAHIIVLLKRLIALKEISSTDAKASVEEVNNGR